MVIMVATRMRAGNKKSTLKQGTLSLMTGDISGAIPVTALTCC